MRNYLVLVSLVSANKMKAQRIVQNLSGLTGEPVKPLWFDAAYLGIPISHDGPAIQIWEKTIEGLVFETDWRDCLVVELGSDWAARRDAKTEHWLMTHLGSPRRK